MGCRTGYKDLNGRCVMDYLPGLAARAYRNGYSGIQLCRAG